MSLPDDDEDLPPVRPVSLSDVVKLQKELAECVLFPYYSVFVTPELFSEIVNAVRAAAAAAVDAGVFTQTCLNIAGRELTRETAEDLAWRIAGNLDRLKGSPRRREDPVPALPWGGQCSREWVAADVVRSDTGVRRFRAAKGVAAGPDGFVHRRGSDVRFRILTGPPAGRLVDRFWSLDVCDLHKSAFGFDKKNRERFSTRVGTRAIRPYQDPREFFNMRVFLLLDPSATRADHVAFTHVRGSPGTIAYNRTLIDWRMRDGHTCPRKLPDSFDCFRCPAGFGECAAACRPDSLVKHACESCGRSDRYFDPVNPLHCVDCPKRRHGGLS